MPRQYPDIAIVRIARIDRTVVTPAHGYDKPVQDRVTIWRGCEVVSRGG
jgi:hypothetical protein